MTNQEIVEKAIQKAIDGGWDYESFGSVNHWLRTNASNKSKAEVVYGNIVDKEYELIFNHEFAKALWGEKQELIRHSHITRSELPGYVNTTFPLHNSADIRMVQKEDMRCFGCNKVLGGPYWINHETCWTEGEYKEGWQYHLQQMVVADDPIAYLGKHL